MAKNKQSGYVQDYEKEFLRLFDGLACSRSAWQVWEDLMTVMACSISNAADRTPDKFKRREEQYERAITNLGGMEIPVQIFCTVIKALEENPNQDFLGKLYMALNLGNHWHGQFFTPYHVCELMAKININGEILQEIEKKGYVSVCDPCVGAGSMLIAAANVMGEMEINYQESAVFVGQDIDRIVAMMAYVQLSLIGCPGYVIVGDSLKSPPAEQILLPEDTEETEVWITPMFITDVWDRKRQLALFKKLLGH